MDVKRELGPAVRRNRAREATTTAYAVFDAEGPAGAPRLQVLASFTEFVDAPPHGNACGLDARDHATLPHSFPRSESTNSRGRQEGLGIMHGSLGGHSMRWPQYPASSPQDALDAVLDMHEYDGLYHMRLGCWG